MRTALRDAMRGARGPRSPHHAASSAFSTFVSHDARFMWETLLALDSACMPCATVRAPAAEEEAGTAKGEAVKVSVLLFTVTFHANHAHNLTRSP
jgi:hypothetical protein